MTFHNIFNSQTKSITFAAFLIAISSGISGVLGLIRDGLLAGRFGVWSETNSYFAAFRVNDFFYNLFIIGGFAVVFLPLFAEYYSKEREKTWEMVSHVLNFFLFLLILASLFIFIFAPQLVKIITPGFSFEEKNQTAFLIRIMILSPILFGLSAIFSGILHYFNRFFIYSLAPVLYNLGIIFGILFLSPSFGIIGVSMGVVLGASLHWAVQIPSVLNCGFKYRLLLNFRYPAIKKIFYLVIPRLFAVTSQQINLIVITAIASTISGGIAIFTFANNLQHFPISLVAIPFAIASFPSLSRNWAANQKKDFLENFSLIFRQILFFMVPLTILLFILRAQVVRLVLGTLGDGKFDWVATQLIAASLGLFCLGIIAFAFIPYLARTFFSFQDTKTPTFIAISTVLLNITLSFLLVWLLGFQNAFQDFLVKILKLGGIENVTVVGLPLALSIAVTFQFFLLLFFLYRRIGDFGVKKIFSSFARIISASFLAGITTFFVLRLAAFFVETDKVLGLLAQTVIAAFSGILIYFILTLVFKFPELKIIVKSFKKQFRKEVTPVETESS
ncbi:murein biosynthesis integral membrane protein MurJ [Patescibacteria group bacterium]|nr:murein biosynthesis integral membrane protein MurJ [Patescibacteria group bacterium]